MADAQGNTFQFGDPTGSSGSTSTAGGVAPGTTYTPGATDVNIWIEVTPDGKLAVVQLTQQQLHDALAAGRHVYQPTSSDMLGLIQQGRLNPEQLPPEVRGELGRMQHADPSIGPVFGTAALPGDQGAGSSTGSTDSGFHIDPYAGSDPTIKDATDWYYKLYGVIPPTDLIKALVTKYSNIYDIKAAILGQAEKDKAPGLSSISPSTLHPELSRFSSLASAAGSYYTELYGRPPPTNQIVSMLESGKSLFDIQRQFLAGAKDANAPGYADVRFAREVSAGQSLYFSLWGRDAPPRYVESQINNGMNLWEMEKAERAKPAFMGTKTAKDEMFAAAGQLTNFLGMGY